MPAPIASQTSGRFLVRLGPVAGSSIEEVTTRHFEWLRGRLDDKNRLVDVSNVGSVTWYCGEFSDALIQEIGERNEVSYAAPEMMYQLPRYDEQVENLGEQLMSMAISSGKVTNNKIDVYVIDSGVNIDHVIFEGCARHGITIHARTQASDTSGHGTHVAGIIAWVAREASIISVKVSRSDGSFDEWGVSQGIIWVLHQHRRRNLDGFHSVANVSVGAYTSLHINDAAEWATSAGVHIVAAAGNDAKNACLFSPACVDLVVAVGSVDYDNHIASDSNHGPCVDLFAPGVRINSAWIGSPTATKCISGTSMASPHVAGVVVLLLRNPRYAHYSPRQMKNLLVALAQKDAIVFDINVDSGTPNLLIRANLLNL